MGLWIYVLTGSPIAFRRKPFFRNQDGRFDFDVCTRRPPAIEVFSAVATSLVIRICLDG